MCPQHSAIAYPPLIDHLVDPQLTPDEAIGPLESFDFATAVTPQTIVDPDMARACTSGLWLRHDFLDRSHEISQRIPSATGSFWHGIMHRQEGDFGNAKYWFRKVGEHPIFPALAAAAHAIHCDQFADAERWNPYDFVDRCAASTDKTIPDPTLAKIRAAEWELLFAYCFQNAIGVA